MIAAALRANAKVYSKFSSDRLNGCVLAVDGIIIRCRALCYKSETDKVSNFYVI